MIKKLEKKIEDLVYTHYELSGVVVLMSILALAMSMLVIPVTIMSGAVGISIISIILAIIPCTILAILHRIDFIP